MSENRRWQRGEFIISTDKTLLDEACIYRFLNEESYWAKGISRELVRKSIAHSALCFGVYEHGKQIGFARVISDLATFAYLGDVFILKEYRGQRLSKWLMQIIKEHPDLQGLRRFMLATQDAHGLYEQYGFQALDDNKMFMQIKGKKYTN